MSNIGNVYVADAGNHRIRKVTVSTGIVTTIAGNGGTTYNGDNIAATSATLYWPGEAAVDSSGMAKLLLQCFIVSALVMLINSFAIQATCTSLMAIIIVSAR